MFIGQVCRLVEDSAYTRRQGGQGILGYVKAMEVCKEYEVGGRGKGVGKAVGGQSSRHHACLHGNHPTSLSLPATLTPYT